MPTDARTLLRGVLKLVAVVAAAGLAGAGIGIGLAKVSGSDGDDAAALPAPASTTSVSAAPTSTGAATTTIPSPTPTPTPTQPTTETTSTPSPNRQPRVEILSARLLPPAQQTGRARVTVTVTVTVRVRVTSRSDSQITSPAPALLTGQDVVQVDSAARVNGGPLLRPLTPGAVVTGTLRFTPSAEATRRLTAKPRARLRIVERIVVLKLTPVTP